MFLPCAARKCFECWWKMNLVQLPTFHQVEAVKFPAAGVYHQDNAWQPLERLKHHAQFLSTQKTWIHLRGRGRAQFLEKSGWKSEGQRWRNSSASVWWSACSYNNQAWSHQSVTGWFYSWWHGRWESWRTVKHKTQQAVPLVEMSHSPSLDWIYSICIWLNFIKWHFTVVNIIRELCDVRKPCNVMMLVAGLM